MNPSDLLEIVYRFYPRGLSTTSPGYDDTPERHRQVDAARRGAAEYPTWKTLLARLRPAYTIFDCSLSILGGSVEPAYMVQLGIPGKEVEDAERYRKEGWRLEFGCSVSLLGPYYLVRRAGSPHEEPHAREVSRAIEAIYSGYAPIPPGVGNVVVPDVALDTVPPGEATIYHCLLGTHWG